MAAILDAILNKWNWAADWRGCEPGGDSWGSKESNHTLQPFTAVWLTEKLGSGSLGKYPSKKKTKKLNSLMHKEGKC